MGGMLEFCPGRALEADQGLIMEFYHDLPHSLNFSLSDKDHSSHRTAQPTIRRREKNPVYSGFTAFIGERMEMREKREKAEGVGFEPTRAFWTLPIFKTGAFDRSAIPPRGRSYTAFCDFERGYGKDVTEA